MKLVLPGHSLDGCGVPVVAWFANLNFSRSAAGLDPALGLQLPGSDGCAGPRIWISELLYSNS